MGKKVGVRNPGAGSQIPSKLFKSYSFELSPALEGKFELRNTHCTHLHFDGKSYDLRTIDMETAQRIAAKDNTFLYLVD